MTPPADGWAVMARALELSSAGQSFALATVVWRKAPSSGHHGARAIVTASGEVTGWVGGACAEPVLVREALTAIEEGRPRLIWLGQAHELDGMHVPNGVITVPISCQSEGALQIYIEPCQISPNLVVVGRSPMAYTLSEMARLLDWNVELVDGADFDASSVNGNSVVVVATQGHGDEDVLTVALSADPLYIGVVASARRGDALKGYLRDVGNDTAAVEALQIPVGLDLGHTTHREVAVAVLAELVERRARGEFTQRTLAAPTRPEYVIDPVCGMSVAAEESNRPLEHDGQTYYFCCPGCRYVFKENPAKYLMEEEAPC